jgi:hypothetical protein
MELGRVENIPIASTRNCIGRVLGDFAIFNKLAA